jgi:hypothetical protein
VASPESPRCEHLVCAIIGGTCSLAQTRSRGCRPNLTSPELSRDVVDEVRALVAMIDPESRSDEVRVAASRLAALVRREALEARNLVALIGDDEPELAPTLARLCSRRRDP